MANDYFVPPERLVTERFVIRTFLPGDGPAISEAVEASYDHLKTFMGWAKPSQPPDVSERYARECRGRWLLGQDFAMGIWSPGERHQLGGCGFHRRGTSAHAAEIGMWIRADAANAGLGTEALLALLRWGLTDWPWQRLVWRCSARNTASARVAEKAGMLLEGRMRRDGIDADGAVRDTLVFATLRSE